MTHPFAIRPDGSGRVGGVFDAHAIEYQLGYVNGQIQALDSDVKAMGWQPSNPAGFAFVNAWRIFVDGMPTGNAGEWLWACEPRPYGWVPFFTKYQSTLSQWWVGDEVWGCIGAFQWQGKDLQDLFLKLGGKLKASKPFTLDYRVPNEQEDPFAWIPGAVKGVVLVAGIWGLANLIKSVRGESK